VSRAVLIAAVCALAASAAALAADPTDPKTKLTKADQARAAATLVRFTDLGSAWSGGPIKPTSLKAPICPVNKPNNSDLTLTGHAESTLSLANAGLQVSSDVEVFRTAAMVKKLVKRTLDSASLTQCLQYNLLKSPGFAGSGAAPRGVKALPVVKAGDRSLLYRVEVGVKVPGTKLPVVVWADFLFVTKGRTQVFVNLVAPSSAGTAVTQLENRIAKLVAARAKA
jgi:hypothetical protein